MTGEHIREELLDLMTGEPTAEQAQHLASCSRCAGALLELRATMALMDEWKAPEVSPYFDSKLRAKLRAEAEQPKGWFAWLKTPHVARPVAAAVFTLIVVAGVGLFQYGNVGRHMAPATPTPTPTIAQKAPEGSAVADLQTLDKSADALDLLDDAGASQ